MTKIMMIIMLISVIHFLKMIVNLWINIPVRKLRNLIFINNETV